MEYIRDCIWGDIPVSTPEYELTECFEMQRLHKLKQLHFVYFVRPSATHSRFSHSLGSLYTAKKVVYESQLPLTHHEKKVLFASALLHDVSHSAYAHVIENLIPLTEHENMIQFVLSGDVKNALEKVYFDNRKLFPFTDVNRLKFVNDVLRKQDILEDVERVLTKKTPILSDLISSEIDVDHLDYIRRDSHFLGFPSASYDSSIFTGFKIEEGPNGRTLVFRKAPAIISAIEDIIYSRCYLFKNAYLHHAVLAANAMLQHIIKYLIHGKNLEVPYLVGDDELLNLLIEYANTPIKEVENEEEYKREVRLAERKKVFGKLTERLVVRDLFKRAYGAYVEIDENAGKIWKEELEHNSTKRQDAINRINKLTGGSALFGYPLIPPIKNYEKIKIEGGKRLKDIADFNIERYKERYKLLHTVFVYSSDNDIAIRKKMNKVCREIFNSEGFYDPEIETPTLSPIDESILKQFFMLAEEQVSKSTFDALYAMESGKKYSLKDLANVINIASHSAISRNFKILIQIQKEMEIEVISTSTSKRPLFYYIKPEIYPLFKEVVYNYV